VSGGSGNLKWLERDGFREARRWNIAHGSVKASKGIFRAIGDSYMDSGSGDIVIKIANPYNGQTDKPVDQHDLVMWTLGENRAAEFFQDDDSNYSRTLGSHFSSSEAQARWATRNARNRKIGGS
jgi:hypothetical protein